MTDYVEERTDRTAVVDWVCCIKVYVHTLLLLIVDRSPGIESRSSLDVRERQEEEPGTRMQSYTLTHSFTKPRAAALLTLRMQCRRRTTCFPLLLFHLLADNNFISNLLLSYFQLATLFFSQDHFYILFVNLTAALILQLLLHKGAFYFNF